MSEPIVVWGAGAIGGTIAAYWARADQEVLLVDLVPEHVKACRTSGLKIEGPVDEFQVVIPAVLPEEVTGQYSRIVLAVKAHHTEDAIKSVAPHLAADGFVVSTQNGLNELVISEVVGKERTVGAFINFGADWIEPGRVMFGNRGAVVVGELDGVPLERTRELHRLMQVFEPDAVLTDNIWGYLWGKLGYSAMLNATALTNNSMADNFADPRLESLWISLAREVIGLAHKRGITPIGFDGFNPASFAPNSGAEAAKQSIADLAEFNRHSAKTHSGVWRDLAIRKRKTEVDAKFPLLIQLAEEDGLEVPLLRCLTDLIHEVEEGRRELGDANLDILLERV
jgi:2-dehydropantoate 2-reductase